MRISQNFLFWVALSFASVVFFQNCGQQGDIALKLQDDSSDTLVQDICSVNPSHVRCTNATPTGKVEEYRYIDVKQPVIPDLKIFLVLDNSDSMRVSQVNLVNYIENMFNANGDGLQDYNSEIFIITTAQLNNIGNSLFRAKVDDQNSYQKVVEKIYEITSKQYVQTLIQIFRPGLTKTSGLLEGDIVGFKARSKRVPSGLAAKFDELSVAFSPAYLTDINQPNIASVKYTKGEPIQDLVNRIKARVEFLDPDKQEFNTSINFANSIVDNVPLSDVVEKESGLCAMARVLHEVKNNPDNSLIKKGELATFILVSDESEHDPQGLECVKSYKFQQPLPGNLYKGECVDADSSVSYTVPDTKTVNLKVNKPYLRHIRQVYETIKPEVLLRNGKCDVKFNQSMVRLKIWKNSHTLSFDRKVMDASGNQVVESWKNDLFFKRVSLKHYVQFNRTTLSHKVKFDRVSKKYSIAGSRTKTSPRYSINIDRKKVAKFQKVTYVRKIILTKEGGQTSVVESSSPITLRVSDVNQASCSVPWLRSVSAVASIEETLASNLSYEYSVSLCAIDNSETADLKIATVYGIKPSSASCNVALAQQVYAEPSLATNESMFYNSVTCSDLVADINVATLNISVAGTVPTTCDANLASSLDMAKPSIDTSKGETLSYNPTCTMDNGTDLNVELTGLAGAYSAPNLLNYITGLDGNKADTSYVNISSTDTPSTASNVKIDNIEGPIPMGITALNYAIQQDGNKANTIYSGASTGT